VVSPAVEAAGKTFAGRLKVAKLNVDESPRTAGRFQVQGIPTLLMIDHGNEVARQVGAVAGPALNGWIERSFNAAKAATDEAAS
jgi:thioredoxin 2